MAYPFLPVLFFIQNIPSKVKYSGLLRQGKNSRGKGLCPGTDLVPFPWSCRERVGMEVGDNDTGRVLLHYVHFSFGHGSRDPLTSHFQYKSQSPAHPRAGVGVSSKTRTILFLHTIKISTGAARFGFKS